MVLENEPKMDVVLVVWAMRIRLEDKTRIYVGLPRVTFLQVPLCDYGLCLTKNSM